MPQAVCCIDQGTSSTRCLLIDKHGKVLHSHQIEITQYYPKRGYVEHDPNEIWGEYK